MRWALGLLAGGLILLVVNAVLMLQLDWRPAVMPLPGDSGETVETSFTVRESGPYEVQLEVSRSAPARAINQSIAIMDDPSPLDVDWRVVENDREVASGDARDYMFLDAGPKRWPGRMRRILMRVPEGQDDLFWRTGGLAGHTTASRGLGRFDATEGTIYRLVAVPRSGLGPLSDGNPRMVVRAARVVSHRHYQSVAPVGYAGLVLIGAGLLGLVWSLIRSRQRR
jgi:hypothetical protein